ERVAAILESRYRFDPHDVEIMRNPTREEITAKLYALSVQLGSTDDLLLFFAGHGHWDDQSEQGYWLPADARRDNPGTWISNSDVRDALHRIKTQHTLLISDACFSGGLVMTREAFDPAQLAAYTRLYGMPSRKAMTSGAKETVPDRSVFIDYLVKRLTENH